MLYASLTEVDNALIALDIENPYTDFFFSSTSDYKNYNWARAFHFTEKEHIQSMLKFIHVYVCAVHTF